MAASARIVTISKTIGVIGKEHQGVAQVQNVMMAGVTLNNLKTNNMEKNDKNIGVAIIELFQPHNNGDYNWGQIQYSSKHVLVGMYEDNRIERQLFYMDKAQVKQLANTLSMLAETMED